MFALFAGTEVSVPAVFYNSAAFFILASIFLLYTFLYNYGIILS